jgi:hypothetical protein
LAGFGPVVTAGGDAMGNKPIAGVVSPIKITDTTGIFALPRVKQEQGGTRTVIHLLNRDYDPMARAMKTRGPFTISIDRALIPSGIVAGAILHQSPVPGITGMNGDKTTVLKVKQHAGTYQITVPSLYLWGIIELKS